MALSEMNYIEGGGGTSIDFLAPDVEYNNADAPASGSTDITVTKKPRFITLSLWAKASGYGGCFGIYDVENNIAKYKGYWSSSSHDWTTWGSVTNFFTAITDTKVTYNFGAWGSTTNRVYINIYY